MNLRHDSYWLVFAGALGLAMALAPILSPNLPKPTDAQAWDYLSRAAARQGIEPKFAYAIAVAESRLDPAAFNHGARGLMQMRWDAWAEVTSEPFSAAWSWQTNADNAVAYLARCREFLSARGALTPALLAACYRYGPQTVADADFDVKNLPRPRNAVYRQLFRGDPAPVPPPAGK